MFYDLCMLLIFIVGYLDLIKKRESMDDEILYSYLYIVDLKVKYLIDLIEELFDYIKLMSFDF